MSGHECYHCKQWVEDGEEHACWITTEAALTRDLSDDLRDAYERLRETAADFGEQRIYASHHCIMFARKACYFFVRPRRSALEVVVFLGRTIRAPQIRRIERPSLRKAAHIIHVRHRDEVETPITDWLKEAYEVSDSLSGRPPKITAAPRKPAADKVRTKTKTATAKKSARKKARVTKPAGITRRVKRSR
jgi:Domain of unknown function (DUF5655)